MGQPGSAGFQSPLGPYTTGAGSGMPPFTPAPSLQTPGPVILQSDSQTVRRQLDMSAAGQALAGSPDHTRPVGQALPGYVVSQQQHLQSLQYGHNVIAPAGRMQPHTPLGQALPQLQTPFSQSLTPYSPGPQVRNLL